MYVWFRFFAALLLDVLC